ncbi:MAG: response regulator transcription factor [Rhodoferax sp.]|nr:response regulator transcription factor [Rhodoferax sp.]
MKIMIVDDHALMREGLGQLLAGLYPDLVLLHAANGAQAVAMLLPQRDIDLVLLDYQLPDMTGLDILRQFARVQPTLAVLVISGSANPNLMRQTLSAGARGFVQKTGNTQALVQAIDAVLNDGTYTPPELQALVALGNGIRTVDLSPRQETVLYGLMDGRSNREIALELNVSEETVKTHVSAILRFFNAENRTQAALAAVESGFRVPKRT